VDGPDLVDAHLGRDRDLRQVRHADGGRSSQVGTPAPGGADAFARLPGHDERTFN
jgi:hypothetical protein